MKGSVFVDTNVLVYARDSGEATKQRQAQGWLQALWESRRGVLSYQILHEYYVTVTRKLKPGMTKEEARQDVRALLAWTPVVVDRPVLDAAWRIEDRYGLSWWDSLVVGAAQKAGARYLLSEDLQSGMDLDGIRVVHPFAQEFGELD